MRLQRPAGISMSPAESSAYLNTEAQLAALLGTRSRACMRHGTTVGKVIEMTHWAGGAATAVGL